VGVGFLTYQALTSLDGDVVDAEGRFDWATPSEEVHAAVNDLARGIGTFLLGRRMYEVLVAWETMGTAGEPPVIAEFSAIWHDADKIVYSSTLADVSSDRTRIERRFDPGAVRAMKEAADRDLAIGGPTLAAEAFRLVDRVDLFVSPVIVGGGTHALPAGVRLGLELTGERRYPDGTVSLHYRVGT
jgi:dihydrofolate reductase